MNNDFIINILDTLTEQIAVIDEKGKIVYVNKSWKDFSDSNSGKYTSYNWCGVNYIKAIDNSVKNGDELASEALKGIRSVIDGDEDIYYYEYPCHSPTEERWFMMNIVPLKDTNYFVLTHKNITQRKQTEIELSRTYNELKDNQNLMIKHSKQVAKGEMLSSLAHHWRQPLESISAMAISYKIQAELKKFDFNNPDDMKKHQEVITSIMNRIEDTTQNLSNTISLLDKVYKSNLKTESITLREIFDKVLNLLNVSSVDITVDIIADKEYKIIVNDFLQVILGIIQNSIENFELNDVENPRIDCKVDENIISICDNGGGIPEVIIDKIFDPYFSTKEDLNGTGLGLYIAKVMVEEYHDGTIEAANTKDGVCFTIKMDRLED